MLEQQIASDRSNSLLRSPDEEGNGAETSAFAALLDVSLSTHQDLLLLLQGILKKLLTCGHMKEN